MSRTKLGIVLAVGLCLVAFAVGGSMVHQASAANPVPVVPYYYLSNFSVKFVCGYSNGPVRFNEKQYDFGEGLVKPGNYATVINIHNYSYKDVGLRKKVVVLARDPFQASLTPGQTTNFPPIRFRETDNPGVVGQPQEHYRKILGPDGATFDDCTALWYMAFPQFQQNMAAIPTPMPFFEGYLVILSPLDLDVDTVYTAESYATNAAGANQSTGISIDVERTNGKRVYCPPSSDTGVPFPICQATSAADTVPANDPNLVPLNK